MAHEHVHVEVFGSGRQKRISEPHRFALLVLGVFGAICCSFGYAFNLISGEMQTRYFLTQRDLTIISTVFTVFQYFVVPYGYIFEYFGPVSLALFAIVYSTIGCVLLALCFRGIVQGTTVRLSVFCAFLFTAGTMFDVMVSVSVVGYFPTRKGIVVAFLKSFMGLGSAIIGSVYTGFFDGHPDWFLYMLMAIDIVVGSLFVLFMRLPSYHLTGYEQKHLSPDERQKRTMTKVQYMRQNPPVVCFYYGLAVLIVLIIYVTLEQALVAYLGLGKSYKIAFAVVSIVLTFAFIGVACPLSLMRRFYPKDEYAATDLESESDHIVEAQERCVGKHDPEEENTNNNPSTNTQPESDTTKRANTAVPDTEIDYIAPQYQTTFKQSICTLDLWALWWSMVGIMGSQLVIIFNASYVLAALSGSRPDPTMRALLTVLNGVGSAVGRLLMAGFETWTQSRKVEDRLPITYALFVPTICAILSTMFFLALPPNALPLAITFTALSNGFCAAVLVLVTRTLYAKDIAKIYIFILTAIALSAIICNRFLYGEWYAVQAERRNSENYVCLHRACVVMPLAVMLGFSCSALLTNLFMHVRYARYCRSALAERARIRQEVQAATNNDVHPTTEAAQQQSEHRNREA